jgi:chromosome partitioning protein
VAVNNLLIVSNEKGGVLKSTGASHLAGYAAAAGWDVLAIDADRQANQSRDLGYIPDGGQAFAAALTGGTALRPVPHPKWKTLHYVSGGKALDNAVASLGAAMGRGQIQPLRAFERAISPIAADYHLIVVDSPPSEILLRRVLFAAARFVIVPCQVDAGSVDGIAGILETVHEVRDVDAVNPDLEVLGAFLGPIQNGAQKTARTTAAQINELVGDPDFVLRSTVRSAQSIATYCREHGILTNEYELLAKARRPKGRGAVFKLTKAERDKAKQEHTFSEAAAGLAGDWQDLVTEIMNRFQARLAAVSGSAPDGDDAPVSEAVVPADHPVRPPHPTAVGER